MACYHPLRAFKTSSGEVVFVERAYYDIVESLALPCGQCVGCRLERSRQWAMRCLHEASAFDQNSFVTLTYDEENLPSNGSLDYEHFQLFMKRLRKLIAPNRVRFYMCGEYGEEFGRPHFHACLFGFDFPDKEEFTKTGAGEIIYTSKMLEALWPFGLCSVGEVTFESAAYVARYCMKKVTGRDAKYHYRRYSTEVDEIHIDMQTGEIYSHELTPEFNRMSLKPGVGASWFKRFAGDVYPHDYVVVRGRECKPPRYYDALYAREAPDSAEYLKFVRGQRGRAQFEHNTDERLRVRERIANARLNVYKRSLS